MQPTQQNRTQQRILQPTQQSRTQQRIQQQSTQQDRIQKQRAQQINRKVSALSSIETLTEISLVDFITVGTELAYIISAVKKSTQQMKNKYIDINELIKVLRCFYTMGLSLHLFSNNNKDKEDIMTLLSIGLEFFNSLLRSKNLPEFDLKTTYQKLIEIYTKNGII